MPIRLDSLPYDLKDLLVNTIDSPNDLLVFALTNSFWKSMIIPNHIQYRVLNLSYYRPAVWKHLAEREDLASGIREVTLKQNFLSLQRSVSSAETDRFPTTLVDEASEHKGGMPEIIKALINMSRLETAHLSLPAVADMDPLTFSGEHLHGKDVFEVFRQSKSLMYLTMYDRRFYIGGECLAKDSDHPLWQFRGLRKFTFIGRAVQWKAESNMTRLFRRLVYLKELTLHFDIASPSFKDCHFPCLRKLRLLGIVIPPASVEAFNAEEQYTVGFLHAHPTIECLEWYPESRRLELPSDCFPNLKILISAHRFIVRVLEQEEMTPKRTLRKIEGIMLDHGMLKTLAGVKDGLPLRQITLSHLDSFESLATLGDLFPTLTFLGIPPPSPSHSPASDNYLGDLLECFAHFPALRGLFGISQSQANFVWGFSGWAHLLDKLAATCPRLCRVHSPKTLNFGGTAWLIRDYKTGIWSTCTTRSPVDDWGYFDEDSD